MIYVDVQGVKVPALGFGTWKLRGNECAEGVRHALELGYRHIDTAQAYNNEEQVGEGMRQAGVPREDIFLTTKLKPDNFNRDQVRPTAEESLSKLGTEYVDLFLMHWPNPDVPVEETIEEMAKLQHEGLVRFIGVSNFPPSWLGRANRVSRIFCNQVEYHPYLAQDRLWSLAREQDWMLTAYSPVAQGEVMDDPVLKEIGEAHGKNPVQVCLRWLIQQPKVSAIPKAASAEHRESNFDIFDFELSDAEMQRIHDLNRGQRLVDPDWSLDWER
jgi:2,5-diketo-D-gluconate reductase B